jgi:hypothetical protein
LGQALSDLIAFLPKLKTVVFVGKTALRARPLLEKLRPGLRFLTSAHPSPLVRRFNPAQWEAIPAQGPPPLSNDRIILKKRNGTMPIAMEPFGQSFDPKQGIPPLPEEMVPFFEGFIPVKLEGQPEKIAAAMAALAARDQLLLESILCPASAQEFLRMRDRLLSLAKQNAD